MHVLLNRKRDFLLYLSFPNSIAQLTRMERGRNSNSFFRASYADGWLLGPALQNHTLVWEGHLEVIQSNFSPRAGCSGPCPFEFSTISERFQNLSQYLQVKLMVKKKISSYLITIFLHPKLCPLCCTLLPIPL